MGVGGSQVIFDLRFIGKTFLLQSQCFLRNVIIEFLAQDIGISVQLGMTKTIISPHILYVLKNL